MRVQFFLNVPVEILVKAVPDEKCHVVPSREKTRLGEELFGLIRQGVIFDTENNFKVANFHR